MSEIRSVSVHLDADVAGYIAKMRLAGAETDKAFGRSERSITTTNTRLTTTESTLGKVATAERRLGADVDSTSRKFDRGGRDLDRYSGRLGIFLDLILGLGPALVPIGATAIPLVFNLGQNFLAAGAGAITAKLAFLGVGNALTAVNKYSLQPTAENLDAARQALQQLSPEAREFTLELSHMKPELDSLRDAAASGLLPGLGQGLQSLKGDLPLLRRGLHDIGVELGGIAASAGDSLSSDRWQPFLRFVSREAPVGLGVMSNAIGDVAHGAAELFMAFNPLTHDIDRGILKLADDFDRWASSLGKSRDFQSFLQYVDENGPKVLDLLGNIATTFFDISRAAAPLGGPILDTLNLFLNVIDAIAKSDLGTPLFVGITAMRLLTRATELWGKVGATSAGTFIAGQKAAVTAIRSTTASQEASAAGWRTLGKGALRGAAGVAAIGLAASDASGPLASNTVQLGLMGAVVGGPWGAAIGAGVGLLMDFTGGQNDSASATADFSSTLNQNTGAITQNTAAMAAQALQADGAFENATALGISIDTVTRAALGNKDAIAEINGELAFYLNQTKDAGTGQRVFADPEQNQRARELADTIGVLGGRVRDDVRDQKELIAATHGAAIAADDAARRHRILARDLRAERLAAHEAVGQWKLFDDSLDDADVSLTQFIHHMAAQAHALAAFGDNALKAANKGLRDGLIKQLRDAGPEGALRMRQLANASQSEIGKANHAFDSFTGAVNSSERALTRATSHSWRIRVEAAQALQAAREVAAALAALHDKTVNILTVRHTGGRSVPGDAEGGTIPGQRSPYGDKVLRFLAPGEEVISNRRGQADQFRPLLKRINAMADGGTVGMANGGTVTTATPGDPVHLKPFANEIHGATGHLHDLNKELAAETKAVEKERSQRDALVQDRNALVSTVKSGFRSDLFGVSGSASGVWARGASEFADPLHILHQDIRDAREYRTDIRRLRRRGLSRAAAAQVTTLEAAEQLEGDSRHQLREFSRLFGIRQRASQAAGATIGDIRYSRQIAESNQHLKHLRDAVRHTNAELRETNHRLAELHKSQDKAVAKQAKATADALNKTASVAVRRRRGDTG